MVDTIPTYLLVASRDILGAIPTVDCAGKSQRRQLKIRGGAPMLPECAWEATDPRCDQRYDYMVSSVLPRCPTVWIYLLKNSRRKVTPSPCFLSQLTTSENRILIHIFPVFSPGARLKLMSSLPYFLVAGRVRALCDEVTKVECSESLLLAIFEIGDTPSHAHSLISTASWPSSLDSRVKEAKYPALSKMC